MSFFAIVSWLDVDPFGIIGNTNYDNTGLDRYLLHVGVAQVVRARDS